ncbi:hypothetical protein BE221DRAFT_72388, partial [Ostreococcus tauri]
TDAFEWARGSRGRGVRWCSREAQSRDKQQDNSVLSCRKRHVGRLSAHVGSVRNSVINY